MASQSQSRLNRLLTLLDAGSTQATRFAAGRQIGEIAKFHPQELNYLLKRVTQYLHNKKWETRVAAAHAIGAVAENVKHASLSHLYSHLEAKMQQFGISAPIDEVVAYPNLHPDFFSWTSFRSFDIVKVLDFGVLLASGGQEYDVVSDNAKDPKEQLAIQKHNLQRRLGLDACEHFIDLNDMISDDDILSYKTNSLANGLKSTVHSKNVQQLVAHSFPRFTSKMPSVRELNLLKRRAKVSSKEQGKSWSEDERGDVSYNKTAAVSENFGSSISSKMFIDSANGQNHELAISQKWPFQNFVEQLLLDVFSPAWEVRHGSAMALREILTFQGSSAGVFLPDPNMGAMLSVVQKKSPDTVNRQNEFVLNVRDTSESFEPVLKRQKNAHSEIEKTSDLTNCAKSYIGITSEGAEDFPHAGKVAEEFYRPPPKDEYQTSPRIVGCTDEESHDDSKCFLLKGAVNQGATGKDKFAGPGNITKVLQENDELHDLVDMARRCWLRNCEILQDSAIRLLCVLVLDRFGDYVSDQVVAPVRETCAQALGAVLKHVHSGLVAEVLNILLQMQRRQEWEIRHGSLLGIKYLVAVRQEMIPNTIGYVLPACKAGLEDPDDDVRAVAADALVPTASTIVSLQDDKLHGIVILLWDILLDLDDLSPSTSSVMNLLAEIYSQEDLPPTVLCTSATNHINLNEASGGDLYGERSKLHENPFSLVMLAPRLWPFMRHSIKSVRHSAIRTLERLLEALYKRNTSGVCLSSLWPKCILGDTLRIVFQNLLLESSEDILQCSVAVWRLLLQCPATDLSDAASSLFSSWMDLAATPYGSPFDSMKMFWPICLPRKSHSRAAKVRAVKLDRELAGGGILETRIETHQEDRNGDAPSVSKIVVGTDTEKSITYTRDITAKALGVLVSRFPEEALQFVITPVLKGLTSLSGVQRQVACIVLISWFKERKSGSFVMKPFADVNFFGEKKNLLINLLACTDPSFPLEGTTLPYTELSRTYAKMRLEASQLLHACESSGIFKNLLSRIKVDVEKLTVDEAIDFTSRITKENSDAVGEESFSNSAFANLDSSKQHLLTTASYLKCVQGNLHITVTSLIAAAVVWMLGLPTKLNPIILPLMASIKREQEEVLQQAAAEALAELICLCIVRKPSPNDKLIKNIFGLTCLDPCETPQAGNLCSIDFIEDQDLFSLVNSTDDQKSRIQSGAQDRSKTEGFISRRGSELVLKYLCEKLGSSVFEKVPKMWDCLTEVLIPTSSETLTPADDERVLVSIESLRDPQSLINNIQMARCIAPMVNDTLKEKLITLLPCIIQCLQHSVFAVRLAAARCITSIAKSMTLSVMTIIVQKVIPMLRNSTSDCARQGAGMVVSLLVHGLGVELVPYALFLVVPLLRCMSDCSHSVRKSVTYSFASLVPLLPLARGISVPSGVSDDLLKNAEDARFLEQLLDNSNIDDYKLQTDLKVTLRRYQQEGINWLAFLRRFKLHGILCDDMGLGKTLQAAAILATDIVEHRIMKNNKDPPLSLIVCPSTLVGHWAYEIEKYIDGSVINAFPYVGSAQERLCARNYFHNHNVVITSYDVVRKDIDYLGKLLWNYCVLDEGHIIKNSRSKVTHAVKQLRAHNRLILSGTPIQNNILDLWSLFDFLMPGFLGSERQFQATYGKPLLAARDSKCSARDAEAGVLAMEALHKQVMPFLLRRTKEDVLSDLPEKIIQDRYCDLSPVQLKLYEQFSGSHARNEISTMVKKNESSVTEDPSYGRKASSHVFQALQYLLKLCSHPLLVVDPNILDSLQDILSELLPNCSDVLSELHELHHAPKLVALREILEECGIGVESSSPETTTYVGQHRVLIFAQHKAFLDIIEKDLLHTHMKSVSYLRLDGSVETGKRFEIVKAFNSDPTIDILLLTTHVGGLGLNLTSADTLVFMEHDWNPMRDLQAMDRAHRLGQRKVVNVHRLVMRGTLEEKVMNLQKFKLSVANSVVNADNASLKTMNTDQLLDLFTPAKANKPQRESSGYGGAESLDVGAKGLKAILSGLEDLWDQSQYTEEYDLNQFLAKLNA